MGLHHWLTERVLLPVFDTLQRRGIRAAHREACAWQWLPADDLRKRQWERLAGLLREAYEDVPFYRRRWDEAGVRPGSIETEDDLLRIPVLTKLDLARHSRETISRRFDERKLKRWSTGGSTGQTAVFYVDGRTAGSRKAREMRFHEWMGVRPGDRVARLWGSPIEIAQYRRWWRRAAERVKNRLFLPGHMLTDEAMAGYAESLMRFRPALIIGFTPALFVFSRFLEKRGITGIRPKAVLTTSATLFPAHRRLHERVFGCRVFDEYGSREGGGIAHECDRHPGALHVAAESVYLEVVKDGRHAAPGEVGEILLTDLTNRVAPLIRYRIMDTASWWPETCPCGRGLPLLRVASGRVSDLLVTPGGGIVLGEFFIDVFDEISEHVLQFQVVQREVSSLLVKVVPAASYGPAAERFIRRALAEKFGDRTAVEIETCSTIPPSPSGKYLFTRCEVPLDFENASGLLAPAPPEER